MTSPIFTQYWDGEKVTQFTVQEAGPHILVSDELLYNLAGEPGKWFRLEPHDPDACQLQDCLYPSHPFCWSDWILHSNADNGHFIYRVGKYELLRNVWEASWPD